MRQPGQWPYASNYDTIGAPLLSFQEAPLYRSSINSEKSPCWEAVGVLGWVKRRTFTQGTQVRVLHDTKKSKLTHHISLRMNCNNFQCISMALSFSRVIVGANVIEKKCEVRARKSAHGQDPGLCVLCETESKCSPILRT